MDRSTRQALVVEEIVDKIYLVLAIHKNQGANRDHAHQEIVESLLFHGLIDIDNLMHKAGISSRTGNYPLVLESCLLGDVQVGASSSADADTNVVLAQIVFSQFLAFLAEGGREHHVSVVRTFVRIWWVSDVRAGTSL